MTTTSTDGDYTRTAELQDQRRVDDAKRDVIVTLYRDGLPVIGMDYPCFGDEGTGRSSSRRRTYTDTTHEAAALEALTVERMLQARVDLDEEGNYTEDQVLHPMVPSGQAAIWLAEL